MGNNFDDYDDYDDFDEDDDDYDDFAEDDDHDYDNGYDDVDRKGAVREYKKVNRYTVESRGTQRYETSYGENPLAGLMLLFLLFLPYKFFTDRTAFYQLLIFGLPSIVAIIFLIRLWRKRKIQKIQNQREEIGLHTEKIERKNLATPQAKALYKALIDRGIMCELEKYDGHKHIDIAITSAKLNIEIDGIQHYLDTKQVHSDMQRNLYSMKKGFRTLRYPNFVIEQYLEKVADSIAEIARDEYTKNP